MEKEDTINLLKECDAGTKMAVASIDEVLDKIQNENMKQLLTVSKEHHGRLGNEIHALLSRYNSETKEPSVMAKGMSWLKTNVKIGMNECDSTIADVMTDGSNMGIKSLYMYLNKYSEANEKVKDICRELAAIEEELVAKLRPYL